MRLRLLHVNDLGIVSAYVVIGCSFLKYSKEIFFKKKLKKKMVPVNQSYYLQTENYCCLFQVKSQEYFSNFLSSNTG